MSMSVSGSMSTVIGVDEDHVAVDIVAGAPLDLDVAETLRLIEFDHSLLEQFHFTVIAGSTVAVPVLAYLFAADKMRAPLDRLKGWLETNNAAVMGMLILVLGAVLLGKGISGLTG